MTASRIAVCSWSLPSSDHDDLARRLGALDITNVQLALSPLVGAPSAARATAAVLCDAGVTIVSGMMAMAGEDYSTLESIARTGGVRPDATWPANLDHAAAVSECAKSLGVKLVTFHAGFLPETRDDPKRAVLIDRLGTIADLFADRGLDVAYETGQESAATLADALDDLGRPNVGVNFDPANMILYAKGDPVEALRRLSPHVRQIHVKDALPAEEPGTWGTEVAAGAGAVDWPAFFAAALAVSPPVDFVIEREAGVDRSGDIAAARDLIARALDPGVTE